MNIDTGSNSISMLCKGNEDIIDQGSNIIFTLCKGHEDNIKVQMSFLRFAREKRHIDKSSISRV